MEGLECRGEEMASYPPGSGEPLEEKEEVVLLEEGRAISVVHARACAPACLGVRLPRRWQGTVWEFGWR